MIGNAAKVVIATAAWVVAIRLTVDVEAIAISICICATCAWLIGGDWPNEESGDSKKVSSLHSVMVKVQLARANLSGDQSSAERGEGHEYSSLHGGDPTS